MAAVTRRTIRRAVLGDLGDVVIATATQDGSNISFYDKIHLIGGANAYAGRSVLFIGGTPENIGLERYIIESSMTNRAIGFDPPLPEITALGDECEVMNFRGQGIRPTEIHDALNATIREIGRAALVDAAPSIATYTRGEGIPIPPEYETVENIMFQDACDSTRYRTIQPSRRPYLDGWWVERATRLLHISGRTSCRLDGYGVRIWGLMSPPELNDDADETDLDEEWLVAATLARLARGRHMTMPSPERERMVFMLSQEGVRLRAGAVRSRGPFSVLL